MSKSDEFGRKAEKKCVELFSGRVKIPNIFERDHEAIHVVVVRIGNEGKIIELNLN